MADPKSAMGLSPADNMEWLKEVPVKSGIEIVKNAPPPKKKKRPNKLTCPLCMEEVKTLIAELKEGKRTQANVRCHMDGDERCTHSKIWGTLPTEQAKNALKGWMDMFECDCYRAEQHLGRLFGAEQTVKQLEEWLADCKIKKPEVKTQ